MLYTHQRPFMSHTQQLFHIQGMRGTAILLVVLFHLLPNLCPSGYLGVDVFFVISGYFLIGRQLSEPQPFRLFSFLKKKSLRLLQPYLVLLVPVGLASIVFFPAPELTESVRALKASLLGQANVFFNQLSSNYFSSDVRRYPLMHLWYMGVLLQCYVFFSLLFWGWGFYRCRKRTRIVHILLLGIISCAVAFLHLWHIPYDYANNTYYWATARIWEFSLGGILFILPKPTPCFRSQCSAVVALFAVVVSAFINFQHSETGIIIGALGGGALLRYGETWQKFSLLNTRSLVWLGGISFSLYLIHWPCICFGEYIGGSEPSFITVAVVCGIIFLLAPAFYQYVESRSYPLWTLPLLWLLGAALHKSTTYSHGFKEYLHTPVNRFFQEETGIENIFPHVPADSPLYAGAEGIMANHFGPTITPAAVLLKEVGDTSKEPNFAILGDSHALDFAAGMHLAGKKYQWHGIFLNSYVTPFWNAEWRDSPNVAIGNFFDEDKALRIENWLKQHPELHTVFIAQYWTSRLCPHRSWNGTPVQGDCVQARAKQLREFCQRLNDMGKGVVVVTDNPMIPTPSPDRTLGAFLMWHAGEKCPAVLECSKATYESTNGVFNRELEKLSADGICTVLHRENTFFKTDTFCAYNGKILTHRDANHLTPNGALFSISDSIETIKALLNTK